MNFVNLKNICDPAMKELFVNLLSQEEQMLIQGSGYSTNENDHPYILLILRKGCKLNESFIKKYNNRIVKEIPVLVEERNVANLC